MACQGDQILGVLRGDEMRRSRPSPPVAPLETVGENRVRHDGQTGHRPGELQKAAWHVVVGGHQAQRPEILGGHPGGRLGGVAAGVAGAVAKHDAALHLVGHLPGQAQQLGDVHALIDAGNEQLSGLFLGQQAQARLQALAASGKHDDRIGGAVGVGDMVGNRGGEPEQPRGPSGNRQQQDHEAQPQPSPPRAPSHRRAQGRRPVARWTAA